MMKRAIFFALLLVFAASTVFAQEQAKSGVSDDSYLHWRLLPSEQAYLSIDGKHLKQYVEDQTAISRRYRDNGHPQFWGRITGTEADSEDARWLLDQFKRIGLADVHQQFFDLPPLWTPTSWSVAASSGGKTIALETAQPVAKGVGTPANGLDLEAVDVALATEGDLAGRDLHGKAVFFYSADYTSRLPPISDNAVKRISERGAAAIFIIVGLPGNLRTQFYPMGTTVPTFSLGQQDGAAIRSLIGQARGGEAPRVKIRLDVKNIPNLKTSAVWGSLPGTTDETIYMVAHRDGWFEGAVDNGSGVATMLGVAEYFAKIPREQRRRTIYFIGTSGHHDNNGLTGDYLAAHKELFAKTALLINSEHTAAEELTYGGNGIRRAGAAVPVTWYASGPRLVQIVSKAYAEFGVATYPDPTATPGGELSPPGNMTAYYQLAPSFQAGSGNLYFHTDRESADVVPANALEAMTRAYAKIITDVNQLDIKDYWQPKVSEVRH